MDTDTFVTSQHALPQNMGQFETQTLPQQAYDQQALTQGNARHLSAPPCQ